MEIQWNDGILNSNNNEYQKINLTELSKRFTRKADIEIFCLINRKFLILYY